MAAYNTRQFDRVFEDVVRAAGRPVSVIAQFSTDDAERVAELINEAILYFWDEGFWPGTFAIEQRTIDATDKYILKEATGETVIGRIDPEECFYTDKPLPHSLKYVLSEVEDRGDRIVCFDPDCPEQPYVRFQYPCPQYTRAAYDETETYAKGDLAYDSTTGECYKSLAAANLNNALTDTDWWEVQAFPELAGNYVKLAASAEWMSEDDGRYKQAARAERELERLADRYFPQLVAGR
jgi:hypothetical protein